MLLIAAAARYPEVAEVYPASPNEELVRALWVDPASLSPFAIGPRVAGLRGDARWAAIRLLAENKSKDASVVLARELIRIGADDSISAPRYPVLLPLERAPRDADVLGPALVDLLGDRRLRPMVAGTVLSYVNSGELSGELEERAAQAIQPPIHHELAQLRAELESSGPAVRWDEKSDHGDRRSATGLLLDLLGRLGRAGSDTTFAAAASHPDPWLALWGVVGQLRGGLSPDPDAVARAAADPECRSVLYEQLSSSGRLDLMPAAFGTKAKLAEAEMVRWLMFPTELGRPPDEIDHVAVVPVEDDAGPADLYVFRFRTLEPHWAAGTGWMIGVAGPYLQRPGSTDIESLHGTFSRFEPYEEGKLREGVQAIVGTIDDWRARDSPDHDPAR
jgi:hypothetical protein